MNAIIFDLNGVLFDTSKYLYAAYKDALKTLDINYSFKKFCENYGLRTEDHMKKVLTDRHHNFTNELIKNLVKIRQKQFFEYIKLEKIELCQGSLKLIKELQSKKIKLGLSSSMHRKNLDFLLKKLKIHNYFDAIVASDEVKFGKPHPESYLKACKLLKANPKNCIAIEDTDTGLLSAKSAGMKCIIVTLTNKTKYNFTNADLIVKTLNEVNLAKINNLFTK